MEQRKGKAQDRDVKGEKKLLGCKNARR